MTTNINNPLPAALTFVTSQTLGADSTDIDFTSLAGDYIYTIQADLRGHDAAIASPAVSIYLNADSTATNYHTGQCWNGGATSVVNSAVIGNLQSQGDMTITASIFRNNTGYGVANVLYTEIDSGTTFNIGNSMVKRDSGTITEITAIKIHIATATSIKAGSKITLYKSQRV